MSKSKSGLVTRDTPQLETDVLPEVVAKVFNFLNYIWLAKPKLAVEMWFLFLPLVMYMLPEWYYSWYSYYFWN